MTEPGTTVVPTSGTLEGVETGTTVVPTNGTLEGVEDTDCFVRQTIVRVKGYGEAVQMAQAYRDYVLPEARSWDGYISTSFLFDDTSQEVIVHSKCIFYCNHIL